MKTLGERVIDSVEIVAGIALASAIARMLDKQPVHWDSVLLAVIIVAPLYFGWTMLSGRWKRGRQEARA